MIRNLLSDMAGKNLRFTEKLSHMGQRTTGKSCGPICRRRRSGAAMRNLTFPIPAATGRLPLGGTGGTFRRAVSDGDEGILAFHKNHFQLLATPIEKTPVTVVLLLIGTICEPWI
jgi:hypothetical protein